MGIAVTLGLMIYGPVNAKDPSGPVAIGDDGVARPGTTYIEDVQPAWKVRLVALHGEMRAGTMSQAEADEYNAIVNAEAMDPASQIADATASTSGSITTMAAASVSHSVSQTQRPQARNNWCGPASAQSVVVAWRDEKFYPTASKRDGSSLSQTALSGPNYTNAGTSGGTDWVDGDMKRAINSWLFYPYEYYFQYSPTSVAALEDHVTTDLDIDWMMASDTIEIANNTSLHFNHHPLNIDIFHWTTIYGYSTSGTTFSLQDPGANTTVLSSAWDNVLPYFTMSSTKTYNLMMKNGRASRGIVW
jgi:hypothetical protein